MLTAIEQDTLRITPLASQLQSRYLGFAGFLRANGYQHADAPAAVQALAYAGQLDRNIARWTLRSVLCKRQQEWRQFDELFDIWFLPDPPPQRTEIRTSGGPSLDTSVASALPDRTEGVPLGDGSGYGEDAPGEARSEGASPQEALERTDF